MYTVYALVDTQIVEAILYTQPVTSSQTGLFADLQP